MRLLPASLLGLLLFTSGCATPAFQRRDESNYRCPKLHKWIAQGINPGPQPKDEPWNQANQEGQAALGSFVGAMLSAAAGALNCAVK